MKKIVRRLWSCSPPKRLIEIPFNFQLNTTLYVCNVEQRRSCKEEHGGYLTGCRKITITIEDGHGEEGK